MRSLKATLIQIIKQSVSGAENLSERDTNTVKDSIDLMAECFYSSIRQQHEEEFFFSHLDLYQQYFTAMAQGNEALTAKIYQIIKKRREENQ